jgi:hypothetical protein
MAEEVNAIKVVFKGKVNERLALHANVWAGEDSAEVVKTLVLNVKDDKGNPIQLTPEDEDVIELASRPTNDGQMKVIKTIVNKRNGILDPTTEQLIKQVVSPTAFKIELAKNGFIKETKKGGLKDLLG